MPVSIWRITDNKAGHDSQSRGLCKAIANIAETKVIDISSSACKHNLINFICARFPAGDNLLKPDLIIAAGHKTHLPLLAAKKAFGGIAIVIMKPSLPSSFFDYCLIPRHDSCPTNGNIIVTEGAINEMQFNTNKAGNTGLILLGGPSAHYSWDETAIGKQISKVITEQKHVRWTVADSPRTPAGFLDKIRRSHTDCACLNYADTPSETLHNLMFETATIWVSKDSISMLYEALSSGAIVGVMEPEEKHPSRISREIDRLIDEQKLISYSMWQQTGNYYPNTNKLSEADRCAKLLYERGAFAK